MTRRRRIASTPKLTFIEVLALCAIAATLVAGAVVTAGPAKAEPRTTQVLVGKGDTLWALAASHPASGLTTAQNAELIAAVNGIATGDVMAGRTILVPASAKTRTLASR